MSSHSDEWWLAGHPFLAFARLSGSHHTARELRRTRALPAFHFSPCRLWVASAQARRRQSRGWYQYHWQAGSLYQRNQLPLSKGAKDGFVVPRLGMLSGTVKEKREPFPVSDSVPILPPITPRMRFESANPKHIPVFLHLARLRLLENRKLVVLFFFRSHFIAPWWFSWAKQWKTRWTKAENRLWNRSKRVIFILNALIYAKMASWPLQ